VIAILVVLEISSSNTSPKSRAKANWSRLRDAAQAESRTRKLAPSGLQISGNFHSDLVRLHEKYGPVIASGPMCSMRTTRH